MSAGNNRGQQIPTPAEGFAQVPNYDDHSHYQTGASDNHSTGINQHQPRVNEASFHIPTYDDDHQSYHSGTMGNHSGGIIRQQQHHVSDGSAHMPTYDDHYQHQPAAMNTESAGPIQQPLQHDEAFTNGHELPSRQQHGNFGNLPFQGFFTVRQYNQDNEVRLVQAGGLDPNHPGYLREAAQRLQQLDGWVQRPDNDDGHPSDEIEDAHDASRHYYNDTTSQAAGCAEKPYYWEYKPIPREYSTNRQAWVMYKNLPVYQDERFKAYVTGRAGDVNNSEIDPLLLEEE